MAIVIVLLCICFLVLLITWGRLNPFLAFLIISFTAGFLLEIPVAEISQSVQKGVGDILGSLAIIISTGAMLGKIISISGAGQKIAHVLVNISGRKYIQWAVLATGFIIGLPLFYSVGFVLVIPLVFSVSYHYKLPAVYVAVPMLSALSVTQGYLPPHPAPAALVVQFGASMGKTLLYGIAIAVPAMILGGPIFAKTVKNIPSSPLKTFKSIHLPEEELPGTLNSFFSALLPVFILIIATVIPLIFPGNITVEKITSVIGDPAIVMLAALLFATFTLGIQMKRSMKDIMNVYGEAVKDVSMILLVMGGAGALKQILLDSGVSDDIGQTLMNVNINPLILAWLISAIIRISLGSATIAGLTTAGIIAPMMPQLHVDPNLMVLSIGSGSLMFSHVNDPAFWMFKEYFTLSFKDTIRSWSFMETIVAITGLIGVLILDRFL